MVDTVTVVSILSTKHEFVEECISNCKWALIGGNNI